MARNMMPNHTCSDRPLPTCKTSIVVFCYDIYLIQSQYTKVAQHKRGGAALSRATSFVVSFVLALNKINIVAVTTMLVFHVGNGRSDHV